MLLGCAALFVALFVVTFVIVLCRRLGFAMASSVCGACQAICLLPAMKTTTSGCTIVRVLPPLHRRRHRRIGM